MSCQNVLLPVELISFDAEQKGNAVELVWSTQTESNNDYFLLQRSLEDMNWMDIGVVDGNGSTQQAHLYTFHDAQPPQGMNYYRFLQVDFNGMSGYSNVESVNFKNTSSVILPNPNNGVFHL
ncbi:MAG: hypothetical protein SH856_02835 [Flavobacteriales bacterium]|nr:hypothetical protein [Flavobacteriales bacterium]